MPSWLPINNTSILPIFRGWKKLLQRSEILLYSAHPGRACFGVPRAIKSFNPQVPASEAWRETAWCHFLSWSCLAPSTYGKMWISSNLLHHSETLCGKSKPLKRRKVHGDLENDPFGMWQISFIYPPLNDIPNPCDFAPSTQQCCKASVGSCTLGPAHCRLANRITNEQVHNTLCAHWTSLEKVKSDKQPTNC